jgi:hypothetical protein
LSNSKTIILIFIFSFILTGRNLAQTAASYPLIKDTFKVSISNKYYISSPSVIPGSEIITLNNKILKKSEYKFTYGNGFFSLTAEKKAALNDVIVIMYQAYITGLKKEYKNRSLIVLQNKDNTPAGKIIVNEKPVPVSESIFGKGIQKSGSIIRGFQVSTNKDFTLNSGLRLQLSGRLSDDIEIVAALSDENVPIQPEGNTERLNEIDKVFVQVKHKNIIGTFGDYELKISSGEFSKISRKLQGLKGEFFAENFQGVVAIASSRGKFNTYAITGKDGNQGPYRLYGVNNENDITVIAGSEKVFVDGIEMKRGENNDYIIEYSNAQITFTSRRLITSASRISVDFEYSDQRYQRNFFGLNLSTKLIDEKMKLSFNYLREGDDQGNLIDYTLSDDEKKILEKAGNDKSKAIVSGVSLATADSTGKISGSYVKSDTTISGTSYTYYIYAPTSAKAIYNVVFTYVGDGNGDYNRVTLSNYKFAGIGGGSYLPVKYLPMPELKQNASLIIETDFIKNTNLNIELAGSLYNPNRFSTDPDITNSGFAGNFYFSLKPVPLNLFEKDLGKISFNIRERILQSSYYSFDRINTVEFSRDYNYTSTTAANEELREINLNYLPSAQVNLNAKYGMLIKGSDFQSDRYVASVKYAEPEAGSFDYSIDYVKTRNLQLSSEWNKQTGKAYYSFGKIRPGIEFLYENKEEQNSGTDSLYSSSLRYIEAAPYLELVKLQGIDLKGQVSFREESAPINGRMTKQSEAFLRSVKIGFRLIPEFSTSLNLTLRNKNYTSEFRQKGYSDNETFLIYSQSKFNFFNNAISGDLYYEAATEQTAKQQKVFVKVTKGTGTYKYLGDINSNGVADENDFALTAYDGEYIIVMLPTDQLYPVVDLKTSSRWNIDFSKIFTADNFVSKIFKPVSTETSIRIEENSKDTSTKDIYLLNLSKFLNDSTTIKGSNSFQQDLFLFKNAPDISIRARFSQSRSLTQYSGGAEKGFTNNKSLRVRFQMIDEISNQTDFSNQNDNYYSLTASSRSRQVNKDELSTDFSYRPENNIEAGLKITVGKAIDRYPTKPTEINSNSQLFRINFSFVGIGRLRIELERDELIANSSNFIPYEITNGNQIGKNYFWRLNFDYRLAANFSASVNYNGRILGTSNVIHSLSAEARAFF